MGLTQTTENYLTDDQSWVGTAHGFNTGRPIELDLSAFDEADHYPDGYLRSGLVLGALTATGQMVPYDSGGTDGEDVAVGHLLTSVKVDAGETVALGSLYWHGAVVEANLPDNHGLDAGAKTALSQIRYE